MKLKSSELIKKLFLQGQMVTVNQEISYEEAENIAIEFDIMCEQEVKVDVIESEEGPAMGGAMLAAVAAGEYASVEEIAAKFVHVVDTVEPDPELAKKYDERYKQFKEIYPALKPVFEIIK